MPYTPSYTGLKQLRRRPTTGSPMPSAQPTMGWEMGMPNPYAPRVSVGNAAPQASAPRSAAPVAAPQAAVSQAAPAQAMSWQMGMPASGTASYESPATATNYGNARSLLRKQLNSYLASRYGMIS